MRSLVGFLLFCCKPAIAESNSAQHSQTEQPKSSSLTDSSHYEPQPPKGSNEELKAEQSCLEQKKKGEIKPKKGELPTIRLFAPKEDTSVVLFAILPDTSNQILKKKHEHKKKHKRKSKNSLSEPPR
jgi:hypothetical protein